MEKADTVKPLSDKQVAILDNMETCDWNLTRACLAAGYSQSYVKQGLTTKLRRNAAFQARLAEIKQAKYVKPGLTLRDKCQLRLVQIVEDSKSRKSEVIRAVETLGRMNGWLSETRIVETPQRHKALSQAQLEEAKRLCLLRFDTTRSLPAPPDIEVPTGMIGNDGVARCTPQTVEDLSGTESTDCVQGGGGTPQAGPASPSPVLPPLQADSNPLDTQKNTDVAEIVTDVTSDTALDSQKHGKVDSANAIETLNKAIPDG